MNLIRSLAPGSGWVDFDVGQNMKVAIVGNSGSGKSTLARRMAAGSATVVLDLDLVFWNPGPVPRPTAESVGEVQRFCRDHESWIVEGCYSDLIEASFPWNPELILMDPGREVCISNCRNRPHEPHKYRTKEEQDQNLDFLGFRLLRARWVDVLSRPSRALRSLRRTDEKSRRRGVHGPHWRVGTSPGSERLWSNANP